MESQTKYAGVTPPLPAKTPPIHLEVEQIETRLASLRECIVGLSIRLNEVTLPELVEKQKAISEAAIGSVLTRRLQCINIELGNLIDKVLSISDRLEL